MNNTQTHICEVSNLNFLKAQGKSKTAIFILHGYGASMNDLAGLAPFLDSDNNFTWFFPDGPIGVDIGMHVQGRAWFPIDMNELQKAMMTGSHRSFADKNPKELQVSMDKCEAFIKANSKDFDQILIGGFSQGSMVTSHLLDKFDKLTGYICLSGTLLNQSGLERTLENVAPIKFFQSHGKADQVLQYSQAMNLFELLKLYRMQGEFVSFDGGHEIPPQVLNKCKRFLSSFLI